ncbi:hypothetical protein MRY87_02565 [bacterium]|nr:hypothetical protein [bacterium]
MSIGLENEFCCDEQAGAVLVENIIIISLLLLASLSAVWICGDEIARMFCEEAAHEIAFAGEARNDADSLVYQRNKGCQPTAGPPDGSGAGGSGWVF